VTIDGSLSNAGTLALGDATGPGRLTISGDYTQAAGGTLAVTVRPADQYDRFQRPRQLRRRRRRHRQRLRQPPRHGKRHRLRTQR